MTTNLTSRADALVEELLKRTIHVHYIGGYPQRLIIGRPHELELAVRLHTLPWQATLIRMEWHPEVEGRVFIHQHNEDFCLSARLAWKLHRLAARLRRMQTREQRLTQAAQEAEKRRGDFCVRKRCLERAEFQLKKTAAETPADSPTAECPQHT